MSNGNGVRTWQIKLEMNRIYIHLLLFLKFYVYVEPFGLQQVIKVTTYMHLPSVCSFLFHSRLVSPV